MAKSKDLILKIDAYSPKTMPMARLAEYMADLATLLGEKSSVHFVRLDAGSTQLVHRIDCEAVPKVEDRLKLVLGGAAPREALRAAAEIDRKLAEDNATGCLTEKKGGSEVIQFPGVKRFVEPEFGPFNEPGTIDGTVIRVGGQQRIVPVHLQTRAGIETNCHATRSVAKDLAKSIFGPEIRCSGIGRWYRNRMGNWEMRNFTISDFTILDNRPLTDVVSELQALEGSGWRSVPDPWLEIANLRSDAEIKQ